MSKAYKNMSIILMIILIFVQVFYINKISKEKNIIVYNGKKTIYKHKTFKEINKELKILKEKNIIAANLINKKWIIKVKIQGDKEELLNNIEKLTNYDISDYIISKNQGKNAIILEISPKESAWVRKYYKFLLKNNQK